MSKSKPSFLEEYGGLLLGLGVIGAGYLVVMGLKGLYYLQ
jgi:hypothetical protein